jgi:hypothetical protein
MKLKKILITISISLSVMVIFYLAWRSFKYDSIFINENPVAKYPNLTGTLIPGKISELELDETTAPASISYIYHYESDSGSYLSFLNYEAKTICIYNLANDKLVRVIDLKSFGYLATDKLQGFKIFGSDSLLVYNYSKSTITFFNIKTHKPLLKASLHNPNMVFYKTLYPFVTTSAPISHDQLDHKLIFSGFTANEGGGHDVDAERCVIQTFDLLTGEVKQGLTYPKFYWGKNWGGASGFRGISYTTNNSQQSIVVSFMADHNIHVFDASTNSDHEYYAGSDRIKKISSMKYSQLYFELLSKEELHDYYLNEDRYTSILFDSYRNLYYRVAETADDNSKTKTIIILNEALAKIGEYELPDGNYDTSKCFVDEGGLNIIVKDLREDYLIVQKFKFTQL